MKILGISGSHRHANTDRLVKIALEKCSERGFDTTFVSLADRDIGYCTDCDVCRKTERCPIEDDVQEILAKMKEADAIIVGSPTYFSSVSGKLKALMDRTLPLRRNGFRLSGKIGGAIAVGGSGNGGQEFTIQAIHNWMLLHNMAVVSDKKTAHFGGIAVGRNDGDVLSDEIGLNTVENLAESILEALTHIK